MGAASQRLHFGVDFDFPTTRDIAAGASPPDRGWKGATISSAADAHGVSNEGIHVFRRLQDNYGRY